YNTRLGAREVGCAGDVRHARRDAPHGETPELPSRNTGKICRSRNDRGRASGFVFRAGFVFSGAAAPLESSAGIGAREAGGGRSVGGRARLERRTGRAAPRRYATAGVAGEGEELAGVFGVFVLRLPSCAGPRGGWLVTRAALSGAAAGRAGTE